MLLTHSLCYKSGAGSHSRGWPDTPLYANSPPISQGYRSCPRYSQHVWEVWRSWRSRTARMEVGAVYSYVNSRIIYYTAHRGEQWSLFIVYRSGLIVIAIVSYRLVLVVNIKIVNATHWWCSKNMNKAKRYTIALLCFDIMSPTSAYIFLCSVHVKHPWS
jgi:hypothetical protein